MENRPGARRIERTACVSRAGESRLSPRAVLCFTPRAGSPIPTLRQFVLAHVTQLVLAVDALVAKNTIQVVALAILNGLLAVYAGVQIAEIRSLVSGYLAVLIWVIPA